MIEIKILESSDHNRLGDYYFCKNQIQVGQDIEESDIFLPMENISKNYFTLEISENKLYGFNIDPSDFFHVNKKKTTGRKLLKIKDHVQIGTTTFEIIHFTKEIEKTKKSFLNKRSQQLQDENSPLIPILQELNNNETEL